MPEARHSSALILAGYWHTAEVLAVIDRTHNLQRSIEDMTPLEAAGMCSRHSAESRAKAVRRTEDRLSSCKKACVVKTRGGTQ